MAEKQGIPLDSIDDFPGETASRLADLWITTAEEFVNTDRLGDGRRGLAEFLDVSEDEVGDLVRVAEEVLPVDFDFGPAEIEYFGMGALDEPDEDEPEEDAFSFAPLPSRVDLHERMPPIRNQGKRGTCVSFSCAAVREYLLGEESAGGDLSEQFLYWDCKQRDGYAGSGTWIRVGMEVLKEDGVCVEDVWQYNPNPIQGNESQDPPPEAAKEDAANQRISQSGKLPSKGVNSIREKLADELPVAFAVPVFKYWFTEPVRTSGDIRMPISTDELSGGHAMCIVGYEDDTQVPGGGYFMVRNSWGTGWGANNPLGAGYCRMPYAFIENHGRSAYIALGPAKPQDDQRKDLDEKPAGLLDIILEWLKKLFS